MTVIPATHPFVILLGIVAIVSMAYLEEWYWRRRQRP